VMRWCRVMITIALVVFWLPATSHALLEQAGWIHLEETSTDDGSGSDHDHDAADGVCIAGSNHIHVPHPQLSGSPLPLEYGDCSLRLAALIETLLVAPAGPDPPGVAPPELSHTWQFSFRASLPPRAPSLIP